MFFRCYNTTCHHNFSDIQLAALQAAAAAAAAVDCSTSNTRCDAMKASDNGPQPLLAPVSQGVTLQPYSVAVWGRGYTTALQRGVGVTLQQCGSVG